MTGQKLFANSCLLLSVSSPCEIAVGEQLRFFSVLVLAQPRHHQFDSDLCPTSPDFL